MIVIVVILTSSMIPIMSSASDARRCREGARLVSTSAALPEPSLARKLLSEAQASTSVPSTEKCSSDKKRVTLG